MSDENGGGPRQDIGRIAPVIPLFGARNSAPSASRTRLTEDGPTAAEAKARVEAVLPSAKEPQARHAPTTAPRLRAISESKAPAGAHVSNPAAVADVEDHPDSGAQIPDPVELRAQAEESLVRKLRTRSLSVSEARQVLRTHGLDAAQIDDVIDDFLRRRYLDDHELAQMLVSAGVDRKGQGRVALSRSLSQRGIPRDVIAAALDELPDDDAERALEFARTKARSLSRLDHDTALRRLLGQLARRGYGGSVATNAAKTALNEASFGAKSSGVRFVESD